MNIEGARARHMLVASHIKPWRVSTPGERLDARNGLTACPTHDVAFDIGLLTVNGGLRIHVLPSLSHVARSDPAARAVFGRPPLADRLLLPAEAPPPRVEYLSWHHRHVFQDPTMVSTVANQRLGAPTTQPRVEAYNYQDRWWWTSGHRSAGDA